MTITGCSWEYKYRLLDSAFTNEELKIYADKTKLKFLEKIKNWDENLNTEWTLRNYMSTKMILASTLMLTSLRYSKDKNIKITENYLIYYSLLNCARTLIYSLPHLSWENDKLSMMTHSKIITLASEAIKLLSPVRGRELAKRLSDAKEIREIFSYKFPMSGMENVVSYYEDFGELLNDCTLIVELAQLNSECLFAIHEKKINKSFPVLDERLCSVFIHSDELAIVDDSDVYWIARLTRGSECRITHIAGLMKEGMIDDFFSSWNKSNNGEDSYDSDKNIRILFDFC